MSEAPAELWLRPSAIGDYYRTRFADEPDAVRYVRADEANALLTAGAQEIARLRLLGRKIARPWIDGGVTAKEWCDAVDAFTLR